MIRRKFRKRPRLFSQKFIATQFKQLEIYRESVRRIQKYGKEKAGADNFGFEVLAPPKIGTTVTAYHRRARLIHRGTILAHNKRTGVYLIQFERKELGWDWVRDIEVAIHGVPEILLPKPNLHNKSRLEPKYNDAHHGSLPHGTKFGPLTGKFFVLIFLLLLSNM